VEKRAKRQKKKIETKKEKEVTREREGALRRKAHKVQFEQQRTKAPTSEHESRKKEEGGDDAWDTPTPCRHPRTCGSWCHRQRMRGRSSEASMDDEQRRPSIANDGQKEARMASRTTPHGRQRTTMAATRGGTTRRGTTPRGTTPRPKKARRHLQGQVEEATTIETVSSASPIRGDIGFDIFEGSSDTQHGQAPQRGPTTSDYGSDSTDRLKLEPRPPSKEVTLVAQTEPSEETNIDAQEMCEVVEQQHEQ
jgi:hypothetical protein